MPDHERQPGTPSQSATPAGSTATVEAVSAAEALAEVHRQHGPDARIVSAEKVLRGGLGGFFQREVVQLTVDVDGSPEGATSRALRPDDVHDASVGQRFLSAVQEAIAADEAHGEAPQDETFLQLLDRAVGPQEPDGRLSRDVSRPDLPPGGGATPLPTTQRQTIVQERPMAAPAASASADERHRRTAREGYASALDAMLAETDAAERGGGTTTGPSSASAPSGGASTDGDWRGRLAAGWAGGLDTVGADADVISPLRDEPPAPSPLEAAIDSARRAAMATEPRPAAAPAPAPAQAPAQAAAPAPAQAAGADPVDAGARARERMRAAAAEAHREREAVLARVSDGPPAVTSTSTVSERPAATPIDDHPDARRGPWSAAGLLRLGVPRGLVDRVVAAEPEDDAGWTAALAAALRPLCRATETPAVLVGPHAVELAATMHAPVMRVGDLLPTDRTVALAEEGDARVRGWLGREGAAVHLVAGGERWREWLWASPVAVSWFSDDALADALAVAADLAVPLGMHCRRGTVVPATAMDVAVLVRERLEDHR